MAWAISICKATLTSSASASTAASGPTSFSPGLSQLWLLPTSWATRVSIWAVDTAQGVSKYKCHVYFSDAAFACCAFLRQPISDPLPLHTLFSDGVPTPSGFVIYFPFTQFLLSFLGSALPLVSFLAYHLNYITDFILQLGIKYYLMGG